MFFCSHEKVAVWKYNVFIDIIIIDGNYKSLLISLNILYLGGI